MSDRTKVTGKTDDDTVVQPKVEDAGSSGAAPSRADRLMGRTPENGTSGGAGGQKGRSGRPGSGPRQQGPAGATGGSSAGAGRGDSGGQAGRGRPDGNRPGSAGGSGGGRPAGSAGQNRQGGAAATAAGTGAAAASAGSASPSTAGQTSQRPVRNGPSDAWSRTSGDQRPPVEDDSPTRVSRPAFEPPSGGRSQQTPNRPTARTGQGTGSQPRPATGSDSASEPAEVMVGSGALTTVSTSMKEPATATDGAGAKDATGARKPRRARLRLSRIDPWSVMKMSFLFSIAAGIALWVAVAFVWWVLQTSGLFQGVNDAVTSMLAAPGDADPFRLEEYVNGPRVLGATAILAVVDVLLITAISTVASFLYNLGATMLGGLQLTLAETDD